MYKKVFDVLRKPLNLLPSTITHPEEGGIRFTVHSVTKATSPLEEQEAEESINAILGGESFVPLESTKCDVCSADGLALVQGVRCQGLMMAVHLAFSEHRPLCLSPDMIWLTIAQGFAQHIQNDPETYRHLFVEHEGKETIEIKGDPGESASQLAFWSGAIHQFGEEVHRRVGPVSDVLLADFSTTGPDEKVASEIVMLEAFAPYFAYVMVCICGIPDITLEGTVEDWRQLKAKAECLRGYGLDWWLDELMPLCDHFVFAAEGHVDVGHWQDIYKLQDAYGYQRINGWIGKFIPYVEGEFGAINRKNPLLLPRQPSGDWIAQQKREEMECSGRVPTKKELKKKYDAQKFVTSDVLPSGLSSVPFVLQMGESANSERVHMEFLAGFVGVEQDKETLRLRPKIGWAVRKRPEMDATLAHFFEVASLRPPQLQALKPLDSFRSFGEWPFELIHFYKKCDGGALFGGMYEFLELKEVEKEAEKARSTPGILGEILGDYGNQWLPFCRLNDGSSVGYLSIYDEKTYQGKWMLFHMPEPKAFPEGSVVGESFEDFLERCLASESEPFVLADDFSPDLELPAFVLGLSSL